MGLRIIKANEPIEVERLSVCIYGAPGVGKTTLGATAKNPLILDFDNGVYRAALRKDTVRIEKWEDVANLKQEDFKGYDTVVIDTVGRALDCLSIYIINKNPKHGRGSGALSLQGYGELKALFANFLKLLNSFGIDVVLIAHMDEQRNGDDLIERLDVQGGSKNEIYKSMDAIGRISASQKGSMLVFDPSAASYGKNPAQLEPVLIPRVDQNPNFLAELIDGIKSKLNELTEDQRKAQQELEEWRSYVTGLETLDDFNSVLDTARGVSKPLQAIFAKEAKSRGFEFNEKTKAYVQKEEAAA